MMRWPSSHWISNGFLLKGLGWLSCPGLLFSPALPIALLPAGQAQAAIQQCADGSFESVPLNYSSAAAIRLLLSKVALQSSEGNCGQVAPTDLADSNAIGIYGNLSGRQALKRLIGSLDLPRERIHMDLWAIQISSESPAQLSEVMSQVQRQIDQTQQAMQSTYDKLSALSLDDQNKLSPDNVNELYKYDFGYALAQNPRLSLTQMLLRLSLAKDSVNNYNKAAYDICMFFIDPDNAERFALFNRHEGRDLKSFDVQRIFNDDPPRPYRRPFQGFMETGLHQKYDENSSQPSCGDGAIRGDRAEQERLNAKRRSNAVLQFAKSYHHFRSDPTRYNPTQLARTAGIVDGMITPVANAINQDIEAFFIRPTLLKIRQIVGRNRGVEYAEIGRSSISGINGAEVRLVTGTQSSFDEPTPLRLSKWLEDARRFKEADKDSPVLPFKQPASKSPKDKQSSTATNDEKETTPPEATLGSLFPGLVNANLLGSLPLNNVIALLAALSQEEVKWQALNSGIQLNLTPTLLRSQTQAMIKVELALADPAEMDIGDEKTSMNFAKLVNKRSKFSDKSLRPYSRIAKSTLSTKVRVNTMDLFALSSFTNQTTITGRRWYVPLIGTIWEGAFGDIPIVGNWFSFKRPPQNKQHQSIMLVNTLIIPSAMGMARYYTNNSNGYGDYDQFSQQAPSPSPLPKSMQLLPGVN
jgi:hypothetical protein